MNFLEIGIILSGQVIHHTKEESSLLTPGCVYCIPIGQKHALESDRIHHKESVPSAQNPAHRSLRRKHSHPASGFFPVLYRIQEKQITYNTPFSGSALLREECYFSPTTIPSLRSAAGLIPLSLPFQYPPDPVQQLFTAPTRHILPERMTVFTRSRPYP